MTLNPASDSSAGRASVPQDLSDERTAEIAQWTESDAYLLYHGEELWALACEVQRRRATETKLRALHVCETYEGRNLGGARYYSDCLHCGESWPCPTVRLLEGEQ